MSKISPYWFIRDGAKLIQCSKEAFDKAIVEGRSVKYNGYANKKAERIANELETSRMAFLADPFLSSKFRNVIEVQVILVDDPQFWLRESKRDKYQK